MGRFNAVQPQIFIRGIGSTDQSASGDQSVGVFIDGVYMGRTGFVDLDFFDLDRVEVLRGPQGTLYGKNVVGGAINLITERPSETFDARLEASIGNFDRRSLRGLVSGPLAETLAGKLSLSWTERDGYATSATTGQKLSDEDNVTVRGSLLFTPRDDLDLLVTADYSRDRLAGNNRECLGEQFIFFPWFAPGSPFAPSPCSPDPFLNEKTVDGFQDRDVGGMSATLTWDSNLGEVTSITAWRKGDYDIQEDFSGSDAPLVVRNAIDEIEQFSQELRLADQTEDGRFNWLVGAYGYRADIERIENNDFSGNDVPIALLLLEVPPGTVPSFNTFYFQENKTTSYALFGQGTWAFTDDVNLTVGARYTYEKKKADIRGAGFDPTGGFLAAPYDISASKSWNAFTPKVTVDWRPRDEVMVYFSVAEGFKSGGFNGTAPDGIAASTPFDQEEARQFELGLKSELLDRRLRANLTAFHIDYDDLQVFQLVDGARLIVDNAADARSRGIELEMLAQLTSAFSLSGHYAYLDTKYKDFINEAGVDFSGNRLTRAPKHSYNIGATYRADLDARLGLTLHAEYSHRSRVFYDPSNFALIGDSGRGLLDARAVLSLRDHNVDISLWGRNLTDKVHVTQAIDGRGPFNLSQNAAGVIAEPRMYGLTVTWRGN
ncbi:MAG: TonB-dependent receptor [Gammaproteobacteria bacterium]|nr:MAG: TonB-dependent receptor [Gammaproteobacteria bacterium]